MIKLKMSATKHCERNVSLAAPGGTPKKVPTIPGRTGLLRRFWRDQAGGYLVVAGLAMPALVGIAGLGTEYGLWLNKQQTMQSATDSGAVSAATAYSNGNSGDVVVQAKAVVASYGFV